MKKIWITFSTSIKSLMNLNQNFFCSLFHILKPGFHYTANATITTQKQSDYRVEQSSFTLMALFWLEIGRCRGRNWLNGNQALWQKQTMTN